jgi:ketosteroid isomerase-like protein
MHAEMQKGGGGTAETWLDMRALDKGKYIVIWKQEDGQWKLHRDIFNSSMPPPGS